MSATPIDRIDGLSRGLIASIENLRARSADLRAEADGLDAKADDLRAELGVWNVIRSCVPLDYALTEHAVAAMDRIDGGVGR